MASYVGCLEGGLQWMLYEKLKSMLQTRKFRRRFPSLHAVRLRLGDGDKREVDIEGEGEAKFKLAAASDPPRTSPVKMSETDNESESESKTEEVATTLSVGEYLAAAGASKLIAILVTYPHEVVRTRMRLAASDGCFPYSHGFFPTLHTIAMEEGTRSVSDVWVGYWVKERREKGVNGD